MRTPPSNRKTAFSLSEILVVIVISAVLLMLLFPAAMKFGRRAQDIRCIANLRSLGVYFSIYANENKGLLPYCRYDEPNEGGATIKHVWMTTLDAYANPKTGYRSCTIQDGTDPFYAMDRSAGHDTINGTNSRIRLSDVQQSLHMRQPVKGRRWLLLDGDWYILDHKKSLNAQAGAHRTPRFRHDGRIHVLFGDLSVASMSRREVNETLYIFMETPIPIP